MRVELTTFRLGGERSIQLSYEDILMILTYLCLKHEEYCIILLVFGGKIHG